MGNIFLFLFDVLEDIGVCDIIWVIMIYIVRIDMFKLRDFNLVLWFLYLLLLGRKERYGNLGYFRKMIV